jgi:hypothetical protein
VLTHEAAAPRRERCAKLRSAFKQEGARGIGGQGNLVDHDTTEGVPIVTTSSRKARCGGGLGRAGERKASLRKEEVSSQLPAGPGTGEAVPAMTTKDVGDRRRAR